jgi:hypothetical protein
MIISSLVDVRAGRCFAKEITNGRARSSEVSLVRWRRASSSTGNSPHGTPMPFYSSLYDESESDWFPKSF